MFLTDVRLDNFNFCVEINLNFVLNFHKRFCIEFTCCCELQSALGTSTWIESLIVESGDFTKVQNTSMACALIFSLQRRFFSALSAHNLELSSEEKNLLRVDKRVVIECTFDPSFVLAEVDVHYFVDARSLSPFFFVYWSH